MFVLAPSASLDPFSDSWELKFLSGNLAHVGNHSVTLKAELRFYPSVTAATKSFNVTILHFCVTTSILEQQMTPLDYQLRYSVTSPQTILSFPMHKDTAANNVSIPLICEVKTYITDKTWLTVH